MQEFSHLDYNVSKSQEAGVPTPKFGLAKTAAEAKKIAEDIAGNDLVRTYYLSPLIIDNPWCHMLWLNTDLCIFHHSKGETCWPGLYCNYSDLGMKFSPCFFFQGGQWSLEDYRSPFSFTILSTNYRLFDTLSTNFIDCLNTTETLSSTVNTFHIVSSLL